MAEHQCRCVKCDPALHAAIIEPTERPAGHLGVQWGDVHEHFVVRVDGCPVPNAFETVPGPDGVSYSYGVRMHDCACGQGKRCVTVKRGDVRSGIEN